jgi:DNA processing protein
MQDIVDELRGTSSSALSEELPLAEMNPLLERMGYDPVSMEFLVERSGLTSDNLSAMLLVLELENKVASMPGGRYQRIT